MLFKDGHDSEHKILTPMSRDDLHADRQSE